MTVAWEDWPPYTIRPENGEPPGGIDPDILAILSDRTDCGLAYREVPWKRALKKLERGTVDILAQASLTPQRAEYAYFSAPYMQYRAYLWVPADAPVRYGSLRAFFATGKTLGISRGYSYGLETDGILAEERYKPQIRVATYTTHNVRKLASKRVDGMLGNRFTVHHVALKYDVLDAVQRTNLVVQSDPVHFMFSKKSVDPAVVAHFNKSIDALREAGTFEAVLRRYQGDAPDPGAM